MRGLTNERICDHVEQLSFELGWGRTRDSKADPHEHMRLQMPIINERMEVTKSVSIRLKLGRGCKKLGV